MSLSSTAIRRFSRHNGALYQCRRSVTTLLVTLLITNFLCIIPTTTRTGNEVWLVSGCAMPMDSDKDTVESSTIIETKDGPNDANKNEDEKENKMNDKEEHKNEDIIAITKASIKSVIFPPAIISPSDSTSGNSPSTTARGIYSRITVLFIYDDDCQHTTPILNKLILSSKMIDTFFASHQQGKHNDILPEPIAEKIKLGKDKAVTFAKLTVANAIALKLIAQPIGEDVFSTMNGKHIFNASNLTQNASDRDKQNHNLTSIELTAYPTVILLETLNYKAIDRVLHVTKLPLRGHANVKNGKNISASSIYKFVMFHWIRLLPHDVTKTEVSPVSFMGSVLDMARGRSDVLAFLHVLAKFPSISSSFSKDSSSIVDIIPEAENLGENSIIFVQCREEKGNDKFQKQDSHPENEFKSLAQTRWWQHGVTGKSSSSNGGIYARYDIYYLTIPLKHCPSVALTYPGEIRTLLINSRKIGALMNNFDDDGTGGSKQFSLDETKIQANGVIRTEYDYNHTIVPRMVYKPIAPPVKDTKSSSSMEEFLQSQSRPHLIFFTNDEYTRHLAFGANYAAHVCLFVSSNPRKTDLESHAIQAMGYTSAEFRGTKVGKVNNGIIFLIILDTRMNRQIFNYWGISVVPTLLITDMSDGQSLKRYMLSLTDNPESSDTDTPVSVENITATISQFVARFITGGILKPVLKSEPLSKSLTTSTSKSPKKKNYDVTLPTRSDGKVHSIKGSTFQSHIMEQTTHAAFVNFYAPYCAHSKMLTPIFDNLAYTLQYEYMPTLKTSMTVPPTTTDCATTNAEDEFGVNIVPLDIVKMDLTKNELIHPEVDVKHFPTLYFFPVGNKTKPILYDGEIRNTSVFIDWLSNHLVLERISFL